MLRLYFFTMNIFVLFVTIFFWLLNVNVLSIESDRSLLEKLLNNNKIDQKTYDERLSKLDEKLKNIEENKKTVIADWNMMLAKMYGLTDRTAENYDVDMEAKRYDLSRDELLSLLL